jgi:hypothetical protein
MVSCTVDHLVREGDELYNLRADPGEERNLFHHA